MTRWLAIPTALFAVSALSNPVEVSSPSIGRAELPEGALVLTQTSRSSGPQDEPADRRTLLRQELFELERRQVESAAEYDQQQRRIRELQIELDLLAFEEDERQQQRAKLVADLEEVLESLALADRRLESGSFEAAEPLGHSEILLADALFDGELGEREQELNRQARSALLMSREALSRRDFLAAQLRAQEAARLARSILSAVKPGP